MPHHRPPISAVVFVTTLGLITSATAQSASATSLPQASNTIQQRMQQYVDWTQDLACRATHGLSRGKVSGMCNLYQGADGRAKAAMDTVDKIEREMSGNLLTLISSLPTLQNDDLANADADSLRAALKTLNPLIGNWYMAPSMRNGGYVFRMGRMEVVDDGMNRRMHLGDSLSLLVRQCATWQPHSACQRLDTMRALSLREFDAKVQEVRQLQKKVMHRLAQVQGMPDCTDSGIGACAQLWDVK